MPYYPIKQLASKELPKILKQIPDPPKQLYYRGNIDLLSTQCIAIVGARKMTTYGKTVIQKFIPILSKYFTIVSGLAFGIDAYTHEVTLKTQGNTIAVLPGGIDNNSITPQSNYGLAQKILKQDGLLLSECQPQSTVHRGSFHARNRIIAGLCPITIVVEAAKKSGSLITAFHALEYNREVCAIPGQITSHVSEGTNALIQQGARLLTSPEELLQNNIQTNQHAVTHYLPQNKEERYILEAIEQKSCTIDSLLESCTIDTKSLNVTLSLLELKGIIKIDGGKVYKL